MRKRYTKQSFRKQCRLMNSDGMCIKYVGTIMPCDSRCYYMVDEWKYYNECMDKQSNSYKNAFAYMSSWKLSELLYNLNIKFDNVLIVDALANCYFPTQEVKHI